MTEQQPELCDPETRLPSSHSCNLPGDHAGTHHCPACGASWLFGSDCEALSTPVAEPAPNATAQHPASQERTTQRDSGPVPPDSWVTAFLAALNEQARRDRPVTWTMPGTGEARALLAVAAQWLEQENAVSWGTDCASCARLLDRSHADHERAERAEAKLAAITASLRLLAEGCLDLASNGADLDRHTSASLAYRDVGRDVLAIIGTEGDDRG